MLIVDTSALLARYDPDEEDHEAVKAAIDSWPGALVLSPFVVVEFDHLVRHRSGHAQARVVLADLLGGGFDIPALSSHECLRCLGVDERYGDLGLGLADASLVVLAERYGTDTLLTLDRRHFRAVLPLQGGAFRLLPEDG